MAKHRITAEFDDFGYAQLEAAARDQGVPVETLLAHAAMYYLADLNSGRQAVKVLPQDAGAGEPPAQLRPSADDHG